MSNNVDYNHQNNLHTQEGPRAALPHIFSDWKPASLLDVGCGLGTWLKAALEFGIPDVFGVDGVDIPKEKLLIPSNVFQQQDLTLSWSLGRHFDAVLCLEVAEHLDQRFAKELVQTLTQHTDVVIFSAAPPWQSGQHHVNCQCPAYWQELFNQAEFVCSDEVRWRLWNDPNIEPWYRQNIFIAKRNRINAGKEERIKSIIHPELLFFIKPERAIEKTLLLKHIKQIENGSMPIDWYLKVPFKSLFTKLQRHTFNI